MSFQNPKHPAPRGPVSDFDLELQRLGNTWDLSPDDVAAVIRTAEIAGCWTAVERITDAHRRRGLVRAAPAPAPRPGPKPRSTPDRAILNLLPPVPESAPTATEVRREAYATLVATYDRLIVSPGLDDADRASLVRQRQTAARVAGLPLLAPAQGRV